MIDKEIHIVEEKGGLVNIEVYKNGLRLKSIRLMRDEFEELVMQIKERYP